MNKEIKKAVVELIHLCEKDGNLGFSTNVLMNEKELYVSFSWEVLQPKCKECGRRLEE